jgi:regulator of RNase E activity RraB
MYNSTFQIEYGELRFVVQMITEKEHTLEIFEETQKVAIDYFDLGYDIFEKFEMNQSAKVDPVPGTTLVFTRYDDEADLYRKLAEIKEMF